MSRLCTLIGSLAVSNIIVIIILLGGTLSFINYAVEEGGAGGAGSSISGQIVDSRRIIIRYLFGNSTSRENSFSFDINFGDDRQFCCTPFSGYHRAVSVRFHTALAESLLILLSYPSCWDYSQELWFTTGECSQHITLLVSITRSYPDLPVGDGRWLLRRLWCLNSLCLSSSSHYHKEDGTVASTATDWESSVLRQFIKLGNHELEKTIPLLFDLEQDQIE